MRVSLLITTYERPDALAAVLRSVAAQSVAPFEVVIGDDGSGPETADAIKAAAASGLPVRHEWLPHDGFRAGRMRNRAVARSSGEYLVMIDDDIVLHRHFIRDHCAVARPGRFVQGTRVLLGDDASRRLQNAPTVWPNILWSDVSNRKNLIRSPLLSALASREGTGLRGIRTCNFALWRDDCFAVNGFDEAFVGWGREDSDFALRLMNSGVKRFNLRFTALGCHLRHPPRSREGLVSNDIRLAGSVGVGATRCDNGLNLHVKAADGVGRG